MEKMDSVFESNLKMERPVRASVFSLRLPQPCPCSDENAAIPRMAVPASDRSSVLQSRERIGVRNAETRTASHEKTVGRSSKTTRGRVDTGCSLPARSKICG